MLYIKTYNNYYWCIKINIKEEIICDNCKHKNWHVFVHAYGICEQCGKRIKWCEHCKLPIKEGGKQSWRNMWIHYRNIENLLKEKISEMF